MNPTGRPDARRRVEVMPCFDSDLPLLVSRLFRPAVRSMPIRIIAIRSSWQWIDPTTPPIAPQMIATIAIQANQGITT
jgi:hypothetical protein